MPPEINIFLIGPRACGKTTLGRWLAEKLRWTFVDLDEVALARFLEPSVLAVWQQHGQSAWREAEHDAMQEVLRSGQQVVALGGGTPMIAAARRRLDQAKLDGSALVIYLQVGVETLRRRLAAEAGDRPSLTGDGVADEVAAVLVEREPTYLDLADFALDASGDIESVKRRLFDVLPDQCRRGMSPP